MTHPVRVSLTSFTDYVNLAGPPRATLIEQQVARQLDDSRPAWWPSQAAERACVAALSAADPHPTLNRMVAEAPTTMTRHYPQVRDGLLQFLKKDRPTAVVPTSTATWSVGDLTIKLNHVVGLVLPDGSRVLALLYFKEAVLAAAGSRPALRIIEYKVDDTLPGARPAILDVRRGKLVYMAANVDPGKLDRLLVAEATGYLTHWQAIAA